MMHGIVSMLIVKFSLLEKKVPISELSAVCNCNGVPNAENHDTIGHNSIVFTCCGNSSSETSGFKV